MKSSNCLYTFLCSALPHATWSSLRSTVQLRGQIDTNYTWSQPQLWCGESLQIADLIDCFYNKHTSFTVCLASGIKIELANTVLKSSTTLHTTCQPPFPPAHRHPWLTPLTPGDRWRLHANKRDLHILFLSSPTASSLYLSRCLGPHAVSLSVSICLSLIVSAERSFNKAGPNINLQWETKGY